MVVVAIIGTIDVATLSQEGAIDFALVVLIALPIILVVVIVTLLYAIRELVLKMPQEPRA